MLLDRIKTLGSDKDDKAASHSSTEVTHHQDALAGPTGPDRIEEIGEYALHPETNNNLEGLRAQILGETMVDLKVSVVRLTSPSANAEAIYARSNLLVVTESVRLDSAPNFVHVVASVITQQKVAQGSDHIVEIKLKGQPGETRLVVKYLLRKMMC